MINKKNISEIPFTISNAEIREVVSMSCYRAAVDLQEEQADVFSLVKSEKECRNFFFRKVSHHAELCCIRREYDKATEDGIGDLLTLFFFSLRHKRIEIPPNLPHYDIRKRRLTELQNSAT